VIAVKTRSEFNDLQVTLCEKAEAKFVVYDKFAVQFFDEKYSSDQKRI